MDSVIPKPLPGAWVPLEEMAMYLAKNIVEPLLSVLVTRLKPRSDSWAKVIGQINLSRPGKWLVKVERDTGGKSVTPL